MNRMKLSGFALLVIATTGLSACAYEGRTRPSDIAMIDDALSDSMAESQAASAEQAKQRKVEFDDSKQAGLDEVDISQALMPGINIGVPETAEVDMEPRFDLKVDGAPARQFFMQLVDGTPYNMVVHPDVKGRISLDLKNITVPEAMDTVRNVYGFDFEKHRNAFQVFPNVMRTRVFRVNYLDVKRSGRSHMRVTSGEVTQSKTGRGGSQSSAQGLQSQSFGRAPRETVAASRIETTNQSDFWRELRTSLEAIIGQQEGRSVVVSGHSGLVVVRALTSELRAVEEFLTSTQAVMQRQVILEAKILEVELADGFQSGINWAALVGNETDGAIIGQTGGGRIFDDGVSSTVGDQGNVNPIAPTLPDGSQVAAFGGVFSMAIKIAGDFAAFIELLKSQGDVQVLSSPRVATVNNQKAVIKVGNDEFFVTDVQTNTNTSTATTTTQNNVELTPFFSGVALDVLPQISDDNEIILHVHPTVSRVQEQVKNIAVSTDAALAVPLAFSTTRESDSIVRAKNGQVVVIGGLMQNISTDDRAGVPGLGDLPVIGSLFRHQKKTMRKNELVILLRPIVVDNGKPWEDDIKQTRESMNQISKWGKDKPVKAQ